MEAIRVGVITNDREYGLALCRAVSRIRRNFIAGQIETTGVPPKDQQKEIHDLDFILTDIQEEEYYDIWIREFGKTVIFLTDKEDCGNAEGCITKNDALPCGYSEEGGSCGSKNSMYICRYKYGNVKELTDMMLKIYCIKNGKSVLNPSGENHRIIAVTGDRGGCGKTVFSLALAQELVRYRGKRVLYTSFSPFEITETYVSCDGKRKKAFHEFLYYIFKGKALPPESFMLHDDYGTDIMPPSVGRNVLTELSPEQLAVFFDHICSLNLYDYIICDMAGSFSEQEMCVLEMSSMICILSGEERIKQYLKFTLGEEVVLKTVMPEICRDEKSVYFDEGRMHISIDTDFGSDVKIFAENFIY